MSRERIPEALDEISILEEQSLGISSLSFPSVPPLKNLSNITDEYGIGSLSPLYHSPLPSRPTAKKKVPEDAARQQTEKGPQRE
jgi:hypothetical protein